MLSQVSQTSRSRSLAAVVALLCAAAPFTAQADERFTLVKAVPDDVFIVVNGRHNPERQFLDDYWGEVCTAFDESGVVKDTLDLIFSYLDDEQQAEATRVMDRFTKLVNDVDWSGLGAGEIAFCEKLPAAHRRGENLSVGPPDIVVMFRVPSGVAEKNYAGLTALLDAMVDEISKLAGTELVIERTQRGSAELAVFNITQKAPEAPSMPISICRRDDVLMLSMGVGLRDDVLALLDGSSDKKPIADSPQFKAAFAKLPEAEDAITFFDMGNLKSGLKAIAGTIFEAVAEEVEDRVVNARQNAEAVRLNGEGYATYERGEYKEALALIEQAHEADPSDSVVRYNLACMHALLGNEEQALSWLEQAVDGGFYSPYKIDADPDLESVRDEPRFKAAVANARRQAASQPNENVDAAKRIAKRLLTCMDILDYAATVEYTDGYATYVDSITVMPPNSQGNPLYPLATSPQPVGNFAKYLPKETVSFSVGGGISLPAVYTFIEDSFKEAGAPGEEVWQMWLDLQQQQGFDIQKDLIAWIDGASVSASFQQDGEDAWVFMLKVKDEAAAREKIDWLAETAPEVLAELAAGNPALAMLTLRCEPTEHEALTGFHDVYLAMMPIPMVCGVRDGWMVLGSSEDAVLLTMATAEGKHPNVRENKRLMAEALVPDSAATTISFTDHRKDAETMVAVLQGVSMSGGMISMFIPDEDAKKAVMRICQIVSKLAPVVGKIDFYKSSASYGSFDGQAWHSRSVTHYVAPAERGRTAALPGPGGNAP